MGRLEAQAVQRWRKLEPREYKNKVQSVTLNDAAEHTVTLDLRNSAMPGLMDLTIKIDAGNDVTSLTINVRTAYEDVDGTLQDIGVAKSADIDLITGLDVNAGGYWTFSLSTLFRDSGDKRKFMHGAGVVLGFTNDDFGAGDDDTISIEVGVRS